MSAARLAIYFLLIAVVAVALYMVYNNLSAIPEGHEAIANQIVVYDATFGRFQELHFVRSGKTPMLSVKPLSMFQPQTREYTYSLWEFRSGDDVNAVMMIWGPGDDGATYFVEISRLSANELKISYPGGEFTFPRNSDIGYLCFDVKLL